MEITPITGIAAKDVGIGADGTMWAISNEKDGDNYSIYRKKADSSEWEKINGQAKRISVGPDGKAWVVTASGDIYRWEESGWIKVQGWASDITCAPDGSVYHVGGSNNFYMLNADRKAWTQVSGNGVVLAGGMTRTLWAITSNGNIYLRNAITWEQIGNGGVDIASGQNGLTWVVTNASWPNQFAVYDEIQKQWIWANVAEYLNNSSPKISISDSSVIRIAVAPNGDMIGLKRDGSLFKMRFNWGDK